MEVVYVSCRWLLSSIARELLRRFVVRELRRLCLVLWAALLVLKSPAIY